MAAFTAAFQLTECIEFTQFTCVARQQAICHDHTQATCPITHTHTNNTRDLQRSYSTTLDGMQSIYAISCAVRQRVIRHNHTQATWWINGSFHRRIPVDRMHWIYAIHLRRTSTSNMSWPHPSNMPNDTHMQRSYSNTLDGMQSICAIFLRRTSTSDTS